MHEFAKNTSLNTLNNFNTALTDTVFPASGSFISVQPYAWICFLLRAGTLDSALTLQVRQDTGATQTASITDVTGAVVAISATADNELFFIEIEIKGALDLVNFTHITLDVSGSGGANDFVDMMWLGLNAKTVPVTQPATSTGVVIAG